MTTKSAQQPNTRTPSKRPAPKPRRSRVDRLTTAWMLLAVILLVYQFTLGRQLPQQWWTAVHLITLGVISNAILQWSWYFTRSLLRLRAEDKHAGAHQTLRQVAFNVAVIALVGGMWWPNVPVAMAAATAVGLIITWHVIALVVSIRSALGARFAVIIRYYVAASVFLLIGIIYGTVLIAPLLGPAPQWLVDAQNGMSVAHALANGLGWVGLTIAGTLVTLGPTAMRTRMAPDAVSRAVKALPVLVGSLLVAIAAATFNLLWLTGVATTVYTVTLAGSVGARLLQVATRKPLEEYSTWNMAAGVVWSVVGLGWISGALLFAGIVGDFRADSHAMIATLGVGGVLQILIGALTYLLPVVVGGGPRAVRVGNSVANAAGTLRLVTRNGALVLLVLALIAGQLLLMPALAALVAVTFAADMAVFAAAGVRQARVKRERNGPPQRPQSTAETTPETKGAPRA